MQVRQAMTRNFEYVHADTSLKTAAATMDKLDAGFLPIGNAPQDKLLGVVTDRDITIRGVGQGLDPERTTVDEVKTARVLYCYEDDSLEDAARNMGEQQVYRLVVLDNDSDKKMTGVISLADIAQNSKESIAGQAARNITA